MHNPDTALAEAKLRLAFPDVEAVVIIREQERFASKTFWTEFITRWRVSLGWRIAATMDGWRPDPARRPW